MGRWLASADPRHLATLALPEDVVDVLDRVHELTTSLRVDLLLALRAELQRLPEGVVEVRELLQVRWLEVVSPQDRQLTLGELGLLLLDADEAAKCVVVRK